LLGAVSSIPGIEPKTVQGAASFLGRFFTTIASDESAAKTLKACIG
jgi:hypothetical protein